MLMVPMAFSLWRWRENKKTFVVKRRLGVYGRILAKQQCWTEESAYPMTPSRLRCMNSLFQARNAWRQSEILRFDQQTSLQMMLLETFSGACSLICSRLGAATLARREKCLMRSERQFAEDELFALVALDRLALRNMYIQNHLRCQRFPHMLDGYQSLTSEELSQALLKNERRRQGCIPWQPRSDSVAQRVLKSVEICARSVWGSNAERAQRRHKAFAYQTRFGNSALFETLTPNTDNSLVLAHYTRLSSVAIYYGALF
ncbi:hypothetical protein JG688_00018144 [Phytophthora aleatoria]|uniref:Helitron helicase-like domain-containing protein n=1 Tax=Phytophthora aleatoria TaxID=2496075 RepID=A0A8J5LUX0_9STRA|nr:hypothetical protein JG688_00018144 [Phytophthora aleatoria]